ncbi:hypothetical protein HDE_13820 [Halotydeus destructor]|nr:hypothetical protein HDE_13820 [Halotydeus destructor]
MFRTLFDKFNFNTVAIDNSHSPTLNGHNNTVNIHIHYHSHPPPELPSSPTIEHLKPRFQPVETNSNFTPGSVTVLISNGVHVNLLLPSPLDESKYVEITANFEEDVTKQFSASRSADHSNGSNLCHSVIFSYTLHRRQATFPEDYSGCQLTPLASVTSVAPSLRKDKQVGGYLNTINLTGRNSAFETACTYRSAESSGERLDVKISEQLVSFLGLGWNWFSDFLEKLNFNNTAVIDNSKNESIGNNNNVNTNITTITTHHHHYYYQPTGTRSKQRQGEGVDYYGHDHPAMPLAAAEHLRARFVPVSNSSSNPGSVIVLIGNNLNTNHSSGESVDEEFAEITIAIEDVDKQLSAPWSATGSHGSEFCNSVVLNLTLNRREGPFPEEYSGFPLKPLSSATTEGPSDLKDIHVEGNLNTFNVTGGSHSYKAFEANCHYWNAEQSRDDGVSSARTFRGSTCWSGTSTAFTITALDESNKFVSVATILGSVLGLASTHCVLGHPGALDSGNQLVFCNFFRTSTDIC